MKFCTSGLTQFKAITFFYRDCVKSRSVFSIPSIPLDQVEIRKEKGKGKGNGKEKVWEREGLMVLHICNSSLII